MVRLGGDDVVTMMIVVNSHDCSGSLTCGVNEDEAPHTLWQSSHENKLETRSGFKERKNCHFGRECDSASTL